MPSTSGRSDHELMAAVQGGDAGALDALFVRHHERLYSFLSRWTGDDHAAEDLVQETFLRLWRQPERYGAERGVFLAWLCRIGRNLAIDRHRHLRDESVAVGETDPVDGRPLALDRLTAEELQQHLDAALKELPVMHREVLLLRGVEGLDHQNIALVLNCSEGAARVRLHRATAALRKVWQARHGDEDARRS